MAKVELELKESTLARARQLAAARHATLEQFLTDVLERTTASQPPTDSVCGMFADEPELMDEVVEGAMKARENWRMPPSGAASP